MNDAREASPVPAPSPSAPAGSWGHAAAVFILLLGNFLLSAPRHVILDDDGYFILAAWFGGVAHPPGYPLYTLLAGLFTHLPVGTVAWRVHACSAVFAALACVALWSIVLRLTASRTPAWIAALCFGLSATLWSQAVIADVYSLNVLLFLVLLALCLGSGAGAGNVQAAARRGVCIALLWGLSLSNHWPLMVLSAPALLLAVWPRRRALAQRPLLLLAALGLGLLPYVWMVYRSQVAEIAFLGPIEDWRGFRDYVSRHMYADIDHSATAGWTDKARYVAFALQETARQFSWPAGILACAGFALQWRQWPRMLCWSLTLGFAGSSILLAALLGFDWDLLHRNTFSVYPLPAYAVVSIWLGLGVANLLQWIERQRPRHISEFVLHAALGALLVGTTWLSQAPHAYRAADAWAEEFADTLLGALEPDSALFVYGDFATGPIAHARYILGLRPDVTLLSPVGQLFRNRLFPARDANSPQAAAAIGRFIAHAQGSVYYNLVLPHGHGVIRHGLFQEVRRDLPAGISRARLSPQVDRFFVRMFERGEPRDVSQLIHYRQLGALYCGTLSVLALHPDADLARARLHRYCRGFLGLMAQAEVRLAMSDPVGALNLLRRAQARDQEAVTVRSLAAMHELLARARRESGQHAAGPAPQAR